MSNSYLSETLQISDINITDLATQFPFLTLHPKDATIGSGSFQKFKEHPTQTFVTNTCLGKGGMGNIHLGRQTLPERDVAIKTLRKDNSDTRQILLQEANVMGKLEHPNIVPIHEVIINDNDEIQVIMKRIQGDTLGNYLDKEEFNETQIRKGLHILIQVCHALEFAHSHSILHRDIKCENIMLGAFNEVYLMDWGLAFDITLASSVNPGIMGTPSYMAPEMLQGDPKVLDVRTDVFLLGSTLHYILTRRKRHDAPDMCQTIALIEASKPFDYPEWIPEHIGDITNKACAKDPEDRYSDVLNLRKDLENALQIWDSIKICARANQKVEDLQKQTRQPEILDEDLSAIHNMFIEILSTFRTAAELSPNYEEPQKGIINTNRLMIDFYLSQKKPKEALSLYKQIPNDPQLEQKILKQLEYVIDIEKAQKVASERDPSRSKSGRKMLMYSLSIGTVGLVTFGILYQAIYRSEITPRRLLVSTSVLLSFILLGTFIGRKTLLSNEVGKELTKSLVLGSFAAVTNSFAGFIYDASSGFIMTLDMFLLGFTFGTTNMILKSGNRIMITSFTLGFVALFFQNNPGTIHALLLVSMTIAGLVSLLDWYQEEQF